VFFADFGCWYRHSPHPDSLDISHFFTEI